MVFSLPAHACGAICMAPKEFKIPLRNFWGIEAKQASRARLAMYTLAEATRSRASSKNLVSFMPQRFCQNSARSHTLLFCVWLLAAKNERAADERKRRSPPPALLRVDLGGRSYGGASIFPQKLPKNPFFLFSRTPLSEAA
jgi:hypothetical protein